MTWRMRHQRIYLLNWIPSLKPYVALPPRIWTLSERHEKSRWHVQINIRFSAAGVRSAYIMISSVNVFICKWFMVCLDYFLTFRLQC